MMHISFISLFAALCIASFSFCSEGPSTSHQTPQPFNAELLKKQIDELAQAKDRIDQYTSDMQEYKTMRENHTQATQLINRATATAQEIQNNINQFSW